VERQLLLYSLEIKVGGTPFHRRGGKGTAVSAPFLLNLRAKRIPTKKIKRRRKSLLSDGGGKAFDSKKKNTKRPLNPSSLNNIGGKGKGKNGKSHHSSKRGRATAA